MLKWHCQQEIRFLKNEGAYYSKNIIDKLFEGKKSKKAREPHNLKPELNRTLVNIQISMNVLTDCINHTLQTGTVPEEWKASRTNIISKETNAKAGELRPIALIITYLMKSLYQ